jgi:hypothetical protein
MARPHPMQPDPGPEGFWSSCDDEQPGVSIRPLTQADLAALLAHLHHNQDQDYILRSGGSAPVVAVRVPGQRRPPRRLGPGRVPAPSPGCWLPNSCPT